jgi:ABC-type Fe3+ transport system substrate-binding protein
MVTGRRWSKGVVAALLAAAVVLGACGQPAPAGGGAAKPAKPAAASSPVTSASGGGSGAPVAAAQVTPVDVAARPAGQGLDLKGDAAQWERVKEAGRRESRVVVAGPLIPEVRTRVGEAFQRAHGISVDYLGLRSGDLMTRIERERQLGAVSIDVYIGGTPSGWQQAERGQIDDIKPLLLDPTILNPLAWRGGAPRINRSPSNLPQDFHCCLQTAEWVFTDLFVNPDLVPPSSIQVWRDLLKPEFKGKIASYDVRTSGPGRTTAGHLWALLGEQYLRDLFAGQEVVMTRDDRQLAEWAARGTYPISIGVVAAAVEPLRAEGLRLERVFPSDGPGILVGGFGGVRKMKDSPNPNAATTFINWFASREAQELWEQVAQEVSLRTDVPHNVPDYIVPKPGVQYLFDDFDPDYSEKFGNNVTAKMQEILGR